jgi:ABC-type dipeptide/oligopeptide/nickel transport system ATPase subunit
MNARAGGKRVIKPAFIRLLKHCGLALRDNSRDIRLLQQAPVCPTSGQIIELIGTRGVGKTTLNNALYRHLKDRWFFRGDLRFTGPISVNISPLEALHRDIYFRKLEDVKEVYDDAWKALTICRQMSNVICESLLMATHTLPRGFILDEGLFKNFPAQVLTTDSEAVEELWRNRAFIHVRAKDPELALTRHLSRRSDRRQMGILQHRDTKEFLRAQIKRHDALYDRIVARAQEIGRPALTVVVEEGIENNVRQILDFEKSLNG